MEEYILQTQGLRYAYDGEKYALQHASLAVRAGERVAVLGSNGAGKSTFFLCLNGVLTPQGGTVSLHGREVGAKERNLLREHVGIVFQNADDQIIASTVQAEVSFGPMNLRLPKEEVCRRVDRAVDYMALEAFRTRPPHYLSGGEKKRVSIADIIAMESEVILFDEPAASLDPAGTCMLEDVLRRLTEEGKTLLISTHDMDFAFRWADRAVVFCEGEVIADGTPLNVFRDDEIIERARLRRPAMLDVFESLSRRGLVPRDAACPKTPVELERLLENHRVD